MVHLWSLERIQRKCLRVTLWSPTDIFFSKRLRPCRTLQVEALAEAIVMAQTTPHRAPCVELSELASSIPNGVTGRAAAIARPRPAEKLFANSIFEWNRLDEFHFCTVLQAISGTSVAKAFLYPSLLPASLRPSLSLSLPPSLPAIVAVQATLHRVPCVWSYQS